MARKARNLTGKKFYYLTAVRHLGGGEWECVCDCGKNKVYTSTQLTKGTVKSCGCKRSELVYLKKYGGRKNIPRLNKIYHSMKERCFNPNTRAYKSYGGRGITVCPEWSDSYEAFYNWSLANGYEDHLTIERIDVNGNYEPGNCEWIPMSEQGRNKRNTIWVEIDGKEFTIPELSEIYSLSEKALYYRYYRGYRGKELISESGKLKHNKKGELKQL